MNRKSDIRLRRAVIVCLIIVTSIITIIFIRSDFFQVKTVFIAAPPEVISNTSVLRTKMNIFFFPRQKIIQSLISANFWTKDVKIFRQFPDSLRIEVSEREPVVTFTRDAIIYFVDFDGNVLPAISKYIVSDYPELICNLEQNQNQKVSPQLKVSIQIVSATTKSIGDKAEKLICQTDGSMLLKYRQTQVRFSPELNRGVAASLQLLFKQFRIDGSWPYEVDLRFEKAILKPDEPKIASSGAQSINVN